LCLVFTIYKRAMQCFISDQYKSNERARDFPLTRYPIVGTRVIGMISYIIHIIYENKKKKTNKKTVSFVTHYSGVLRFMNKKTTMNNNNFSGAPNLPQEVKSK